jgi:hypothetical protein
MVTPDNKREASADTVAPRHYRCGSGRGRRGPHRGQQIGKHRASDILIEKGTDVTAVATDHRAPPDRAVHHRQSLDHAELRHGIQFRPTPRARHHHAEYASSLHCGGERRRDTTALLDLLARRPDLRA